MKIKFYAEGEDKPFAHLHPAHYNNEDHENVTLLTAERSFGEETRVVCKDEVIPFKNLDFFIDFLKRKAKGKKIIIK